MLCVKGHLEAIIFAQSVHGRVVLGNSSLEIFERFQIPCALELPNQAGVWIQEFVRHWLRDEERSDLFGDPYYLLNGVEAVVSIDKIITNHIVSNQAR